MKKAIAAITVIAIVGAAGYWGWNEYTIDQLSTELTVAASSQSTSADGQQFLKSFSRLVAVSRKAEQSKMALFGARYEALGTKCASMLKRSPSTTAQWVKTNRSSAWSPIGSELRPKDRISDKELVDAVRRLKSVCETGIAAQDKIAQSAKNLRVAPASIEGMAGLASEVKTTATQASDLAEVGQRIAKTKGRARGQVQEGLREIDRANRKIEKYAELSTLRTACSDWDSAQSTIASSRSALSSLPSFGKTYQTKTANALVKSDRAKVDDMLSKIGPHVRRARAELAKAEQQERTVAGRAERAVGRFFNRAKEKVSQSRIGREVTVSFKTMVLGTKMFYDMMDMDSSTDMMGWAMKYEGDMNQLMNEVEAVNNMDGWSLTGKNTFIEDLTGKAYEKSFYEK